MAQVLQKPFFRHPLFWTIFIAASLAAACWTYYYFSTAMPLLDITISMNRTEALEKASEIAHRYKLGPQHYSAAAYFSADSTAQNYIELERGGTQAWKEFITNTDYYPYTWVVRHFKEGDAHEAYFIFTPTGKPYGFIETIPQALPGAALSFDEARRIAEQTAEKQWDIPIKEYRLKNARKELRSSGRMDHTFNYEKEIKNLGDAHYLLTIVVTGDKVSTVNHTIDIPESFTKKYQHMRSFNEMFYSLASAFMYLMYLLIGCLGAILYFLKKNWLLAKQALWAGFILALLSFLTNINRFPLLWLSYNTALSKEVFLIQTFFGLLLNFFQWFAIYTMTFVAAEALTRRAFGGHMQLWSAWKLPATSSHTMLTKMGIAYLYLSFDLAFLVLFYMLGMRYLGWWSPTGMLTDPNILSSYVPAFDALAHSITAGFWEEALFRAVPLAIAALIGKRTAYFKSCMVIGFIIQALVFGAAHASYAALPSYVRIIELILPSINFGAIYLLFGLIPAMIAHTLIDVVLFSLPLFASQAPGMWIQQALVILVCLIPFIIIGISRLKTGKWLPLSPAIYNGAWQPVSNIKEAEPFYNSHLELPSSSFSRKKMIGLAFLGLAGFALWLWSTPFDRVPSLQLTKSEAVEVLQKSGQMPRGEWSIIPSITWGQDPLPDERLFVWQTYGKEKYTKLYGSYLQPLSWLIRCVHFKGSPEERAEEFRFIINNNGVSAHNHILSQTAARKTISEKEARALAFEYIEKKYHVMRQNLAEIIVQSEKLPHRTDWHLSFSEPAILPDNQARISLSIADDEVISAERSIHIPESWTREQRLSTSLIDCITMVRTIAWFLFIIIATLLALLLWQRNALHFKMTFVAVFCFIIVSLLVSFNNLPATYISFITSKPLFLQLGLHLLREVQKIIFDSLTIGLGVAVLFNTHIISGLSRHRKIIAAIASGLAVAATLAVIHTFMPSQAPTATITGADSFIPAISYIWNFVTYYVRQTLYLQILAYFAVSSHSWQRKALALFVAVLLFTPYETITSLDQWGLALLCITLLTLFLYHQVIRFQPNLMPLINAVLLIGSLATEAYAAAWPGAAAYAVLTMMVISLIAYFWQQVKAFSNT